MKLSGGRADVARALGWTYLILCGGFLAAGALLCVGLARDPAGGPALHYVGPLFLMVAAVYLVPGVVGGIGLLRGAAWRHVTPSDVRAHSPPRLTDAPLRAPPLVHLA